MLPERKFPLATIAVVSVITLIASYAIPQESAAATDLASAHSLFTTSDQCIACHSNVVGPEGQELSIGYTWRASMMANSARDPYWQAAVRREIMDHPQVQKEIEDTCSTCHMPMARFAAATSGALGGVFEYVNGTNEDAVATAHAMDGVSCTVCHQMSGENFGQASSFDGGFIIDTTIPPGERPIFGPFDVDAGRRRIMQSATTFLPTEAKHVQQSELCATCHTLFTQSLNELGENVGELPEQVPYLEWLNSDYRETKSCQDCHMPEVEGHTPTTSVLGQNRPSVSQHVFRGGNAFMLRLLSKYRDELGVTALPEEFEASALRTEKHLQTETANLQIQSARVSDSKVTFKLAIDSKAGHKLPTAYPSRRAWLHVTLRDKNQNVVFESGAIRPDGSIVGNANDDDASQYEPHYSEIDSPDQVQIYEPILADDADRVTTGLLFAVRYIKDNRLLPLGFDKTTVAHDIAVQGRAAEDRDFRGGSDGVRYTIDVTGSQGPWTVTAKLHYQSIGYRWAQNLKKYNAAEPQRFVSYYEDNAELSAVIIAERSSQID